MVYFLPTIMPGSDVDNVEDVTVPPPPPRPDFSLSQHTPGARITCELLNGKNFAAWSRSVRLFLGGKGKSGWLLGTITKPAATDPKFVQWEIDNCTILGWLFNSMEPRIYHVFMYHDMVPLLWSSLTKMYAHARNEARIFELYREIHQASQASLSLSVADYFAYLQSRWEELAQYEPLSEFTTEGGIAARRLDRQHTYQFLMGLKPEFEALRTQIVNTTPMPSIFEAFAMLDGDERRHRLLQLPPPPVPESPIPDQMALAASGSRFSSGRSSSGRAPCSFCGGVTHVRDRCFKLHPELRETFKRNKEKSKASPRTAAISETSYGSPAAPTVPDLHQLQTQFQNQMEQLQSQFQTQLGSLMQQTPRPNPSPSTATLASGIPTALHVRSSNPSWVLDSGADDHMTGELSLFTSPLFSIDQFVRIADGSAVHVRSKGDVCLSSQLTLSSVLYVPDFAYNLLSVSRLARDYKCDVIFSSHTCLLQDQNSKKIFGRGYERNGLYYFGDPPDSVSSMSLQASVLPSLVSTPFSLASLKLWHARLGHANFQYLCQLFPLMNKTCQKFRFNCIVCELSKHVRSSYIPRMHRAPAAFDIIHSDVWGPSPVTSLLGHRYYVTFIDDYTRCTWVYLMKKKSEVFSLFMSFLQMIKTQFKTTVRTLRSDNGREYVSNDFRSTLSQHGLLQQFSCPYTPEQNGVAERKNRSIMTVVRCLLCGMHVPKHFWDMAVLTATYLLNRTPSRILLGKAPLHLLQPGCTLFPILPRVFGCTCFVQNRSPSRTKLDDKAFRCVFLGYSFMSKGYRCYDPLTRHMHNSFDVTFLEDVPFFAGTPPSLDPRQGEAPEDPSMFPRPVPLFESPQVASPTLPSVITSDPRHMYSHRPPASDPLPQSSPESGNVSPISSPVLRRYPTRDRRPPDKLGFSNPNATKHSIAQYVSYQGISDSYRTFIGHVSSTPIPRSVSEALRDPNWVTAMQVEMAALQQNHTWDLVSLPRGVKTVGCKWVFTVKYQADGTIERYKARLVAKGFTQVPGQDYGATFAPVAKLTTVRVIISLAASYSWPLHQLDVKNAFLNGDLHETIYMDPPPGFRAEGEYTGKVCRLRKSLYGLKQSPRAWFSRFSEVVLSMNFIRCQSDHTCFIHRRPDGRCVIISVYVDDIIITGDDTSGIEKVKQTLRKAFDTKDLGHLRYFLGIEVARSRRGISLSQRKYVLDLLQDTGMMGCRPASSPMDPNFKLSLESGDLLPDATQYQRLVGRLIYLTHTRPDISFAVSVVSQFMHAPRTSHLDAVHQILRYLKTCPGLGLFYTSGEQCGVSCFTDADYAGSKTDRRSTSGFCTFRGTHLLSWKSKKQAVVSRSSAEAEYRAMAQGTCELMWLRSLLTELGFPAAGSSTLFCDNKSAIMLASDSVLHERTKHIEVDVHFIREKVRSGVITPHFVPSSEQVADMFTKSIGPSLLKTSLSKLGLVDIFAPA